MICSHFIRSPLGPLLLSAEDDWITKIHFCDQEVFESDNTLLPVILEAEEQLQAYFDGQIKDITFPMKPQGTEFQQKVWKLLSEIPYGVTWSYQQMAKRYGDPLSIRAIAAANGKNPIAIAIPCHRVIGSDGSLTGYAGGLEKKKWLLAHEGLPVFQQTSLFSQYS